MNEPTTKELEQKMELLAVWLTLNGPKGSGVLIGQIATRLEELERDRERLDREVKEWKELYEANHG